jgi:alpha-beta hydrolase superfamily lysophospholipase
MVFPMVLSMDARKRGRLKRTLHLALVTIVLLMMALNVLAYRHAYALTHFTRDGVRTGKPETLSVSEKLRVLVRGPIVPRPRNRRTPKDLGLGYERHVFAGARGLPIEGWYIPRPRSRGVIVMFHGHADSKDSQLKAASIFGEMGYSAFPVDFYGSGGSGGSETSIGFHEATDVASAYEYARHLPGQTSVILYGGSMGAAAILKAVGDGRLEPDAIILECPFDSLVGTVRHRFETMGLPSFPAAELLIFWGGWQQGFNGFRMNPADDARAVRSPVLLMNGDSDPWVTLEEAQRIFDHLQGPKRFRVFHGLKHQSFLNARPAEWKQSVSGFLAEQEDRPPRQ